MFLFEFDATSSKPSIMLSRRGVKLFIVKVILTVSSGQAYKCLSEGYLNWENRSGNISFMVVTVSDFYHDFKYDPSRSEISL